MYGNLILGNSAYAFSPKCLSIYLFVLNIARQDGNFKMRNKGLRHRQHAPQSFC